jgi:hypothetical protein
MPFSDQSCSTLVPPDILFIEETKARHPRPMSHHIDLWNSNLIILNWIVISLQESWKQIHTHKNKQIYTNTIKHTITNLHTHSTTPTHALTNLHTQSPTHTHPHKLTHTPSQTYTHNHPLTHTLTNLHTQSPTHTHPHKLTHTITPTHNYNLTNNHSHTPTQKHLPKIIEGNNFVFQISSPTQNIDFKPILIMLLCTFNMWFKLLLGYYYQIKLSDKPQNDYLQLAVPTMNILKGLYFRFTWIMSWANDKICVCNIIPAKDQNIGRKVAFSWRTAIYNNEKKFFFYIRT